MNILGISVYKNGVISVRGNGDVYTEFYKWQRTLVSAKDIRVDWPFHYFVLNSEKEYKELFRKYKKYISYANEDYELE